jgi:hypothetical protein
MTDNKEFLRETLFDFTGSREGRRLLASYYADAECHHGEPALLALLAYVIDPKLAPLLQRQRADEVRHAEIFARVADGMGGPIAIPYDLHPMHRLDRALGDFRMELVARLPDAHAIMEASLVGQVLAERATLELDAIQEALRPRSARAAAAFRDVLRDEERHIGLCSLIARRHAPSPSILETTLARLREVEASVNDKLWMDRRAHAQNRLRSAA